jgi:very-short-patch-repair endonuclease
MVKGKPKRDSGGKYVLGSVPSNKIVLPKEELKLLYQSYGAKKIADYYGVSKQAVLRNLHEYEIPIRSSGAPSVMPEYWREALKKPRSVPAWSKGLTKETDERVRRISESLKGENNYMWKPELHTGELVECACGCGGLRSKYDKKGRIRNYIKGHSKKGLFEKGHIPWNKDKKWDTETIRRILTRRTPNKQEKYLIALFGKHDLPYRFVGDGQIVIGGRNPDFINEENCKIIEFFGEHWHEPEDEHIKRKIYIQYGYEMLEIWGKDLRDEEKLLVKILEFGEVS